MSTRWMALGGALLAVGLLAFGGWWSFLRGDEPPPVSLEEAVAAVSSSTASPTPTPPGTATPGDGPASGVAATESPSPAGGDGSAGEGASLQGRWVVVPGDSFVGYRIQEELARIGSTTAVGRTSDVEGTLEFDGASVTTVAVTANLQTLASDDSRRDGQLRRQALETNTYPEASFTLAEPIAIEGDPADGETISATAVGDLALHGVTRRVEIPLEGRLVDGQVVVVGSLEVLLADYGIDRPTAPLVLSVSEQATVEMQLVFRKE